MWTHHSIIYAIVWSLKGFNTSCSARKCSNNAVHGFSCMCVFCWLLNTGKLQSRNRDSPNCLSCINTLFCVYERIYTTCCNLRACLGILSRTHQLASHKRPKNTCTGDTNKSILYYYLWILHSLPLKEKIRVIALFSTKRVFLFQELGKPRSSGCLQEASNQMEEVNINIQHISANWKLYYSFFTFLFYFY